MAGNAAITVLAYPRRAGNAAHTTIRAEEPKGVLLLYKDEVSLLGERAADNGIRSVLGNKPEIQIYSEHLDTSLFPDPKFQAAELAWLRSKYRDQRIDLIITVALPSQTIFPGIIHQGGAFGGMSLYTKGGKAKFAYNFFGLRTFTTEAGQAIPAGKLR